MRRLLIIFALALPLLSSGCAFNGDETTRINQVLMNTHLTPAEKNAKVAEIKSQGDSPLSAPWIPTAAIVVVGILVLGIAVVLRRGREPVERPQEAPVPVAQDAPASVGMAPSAASSAPASPMTPAERLAAARAGSATPSVPAVPIAFEPEVDDEAQPAPLPVLDTLPTTQAQVDAIPLNNRGISFFTSRPLSLDDLVEVPIVIGGQIRSVYTTPKEAENVQRGDVPPVRSFAVDNASVPWYKCAGYDPYRSFWEVVAQGYVVLDGQCPSTWLALGELSPDTADYASRIATGNEPAQSPAAPPVSVANEIAEAAVVSKPSPEPVAESVAESAPAAEPRSEPAEGAAVAETPGDQDAKPHKKTAKIGPSA